VLASKEHFGRVVGCGQLVVGWRLVDFRSKQPTTNNQQPTTNNQQPTTNNQPVAIQPIAKLLLRA